VFRPQIRCRYHCSRDSLLARCFQFQPPKYREKTNWTDKNTKASTQHCAVLRRKAKLLCVTKAVCLRDVVTSRNATKQREREREREIMLPNALAIKLLLKEKKNLSINAPCVKMTYTAVYEMFMALCTAISLYSVFCA